MDQLIADLQVANDQRDAAVAQQAAAVAARIAAEALTAQAITDAAAAQAATAAALAARGPPGPTVFTLSPALASSNALLNYNTSEGIKIYNKSTTPMEVPYNGGSGGLRLFLSKVQQKANQFGWDRILTIRQGVQPLNLIASYGQVDLASVRAQALAIEAAASRDTQNSSQMYLFLKSSLTDGLLGRVISHMRDYMSVTGFEDGPSLLKVIITLSHVDTRAQSGYIRQCLARLPITILTEEYSCDIEKINKYVIVLKEGLAARGESSQDTMMNVQAAYEVCKDAAFVRHTRDEYSKWEQGATMTLKDYMSSALTKYKTLKMKGQWEAPSPEQEQIIALVPPYLPSRQGREKHHPRRTRQGRPPPTENPPDQGRTREPSRGRTSRQRQVTPKPSHSKARPTIGAPITPTRSGLSTTCTRSLTCASSTPATQPWKLRGRSGGETVRQGRRQSALPTSNSTAHSLKSTNLNRNQMITEKGARLTSGSGRSFYGFCTQEAVQGVQR